VLSSVLFIDQSFYLILVRILLSEYSKMWLHNFSVVFGFVQKERYYNPWSFGGNGIAGAKSWNVYV
jgi:hypothetical protein